MFVQGTGVETEEIGGGAREEREELSGSNLENNVEDKRDHESKAAPAAGEESFSKKTKDFAG